MFTDFALNGGSRGEFGESLQQMRFDPGLMRPYQETDGKMYCTVNTGTTVDEKGNKIPKYEVVSVRDLQDSGIPVQNATLALRKDEWKQIDDIIVPAVRTKTRVYGDLASANSYGGFDGMAKGALQYEKRSKSGSAQLSMDGLAEADGDAPLHKEVLVPLPIAHSDFYFSQRELAISRNTGAPIDSVQAQESAEEVGELIEKLTLGTVTAMTYGGGTIYGYTNHPDRYTKADMTAPTATNGVTVVNEVLEIIEDLDTDGFDGPFVVYFSTGYSKFLNNELKPTTSNTITTRQRLLEVDNISAVRRAKFLTGDQVIVVQMTPNVARAINGMSVRTVQWATHGGMKTNFKVMGIQIPDIRSTYEGKTGFGHGTTS